MIKLLDLAFLFSSVYSYFYFGCVFFSELKRSLLMYCSFVLVASGLLSEHFLFMGFFSLSLVVLAFIIHSVVLRKIVNKDKKFGFLYASITSMPAIIFLVRGVCN